MNNKINFGIFFLFITIGDFIKCITEIIYVQNDFNIVTTSLVFIHIIFFLFLIIIRFICLYYLIYNYTFSFFVFKKILKVILLLSLVDISIISLLAIYTQLFQKYDIIILGCMLSFIISFTHILIYIKEYIKTIRSTPEPKQNTFFIVEGHICKENCDMCPCIICSETIDIFVELKCKHQLHHNCLIKWLNQKKTTCPLCRSEV